MNLKIGNEMYKLGTKNVREIATDQVGTLTHMQVEMDGGVFYLFQPAKLNPETGQPVPKLWCVPNRLRDCQCVPTPKLPLEVLGTKVRDGVTGFEGVATAMQVHINGCVHVFVQPAGLIEKNNSVIAQCDFDIRRLEGDAVKRLSDSELAESIQKNPSPEGSTHYSPGVS